MRPFFLSWAAQALHAKLYGGPDTRVQNICTDTRSLEPGDLFFALVGENTDGHLFLADASAKGAVGAVVHSYMPDIPLPQIVVPNTLTALGDLANAYRMQFSIPVVGITGSVGKTSTKELAAALLSTHYKTLANPKNLNTEIGVPLTLFQLEETHEAAVIEMGMRGLGQINRLAEIVAPLVGVITNIGYAHIELLGSRENIAKAKSELLTHLHSSGTAVLPADCDFLPYLQSRVPSSCRILTFSGQGAPADISVLPIQIDERGHAILQVTIEGQRWQVPLAVLGKHHATNAAAALAVAMALEVPLEKALAALSQWRGVEGRLVSRRTAQGALLLDDCYNAGVESVIAALDTLASLATPANRVAILGDMKELGDFAPQAHRIVGEKIVEIGGVRLLITVGPLARRIAEAAELDSTGKELPLVHRHFDTSEEAAKLGELSIFPSDVVLVKGSRAMRMEQIVATLTAEKEASHA